MDRKPYEIERKKKMNKLTLVYETPTTIGGMNIENKVTFLFDEKAEMYEFIEIALRKHAEVSMRAEIEFVKG